MKQTTALKIAIKSMKDEIKFIKPEADAWDKDQLDHPGFKYASRKRKRLARAVEILEQIITGYQEI
jgi:hypothetical protein